MKTNPLGDQLPKYLTEISRPAEQADWVEKIFEAASTLPGSAREACRFVAPSKWSVGIVAVSELGQIEYVDQSEAELLKKDIETGQPNSFVEPSVGDLSKFRVYGNRILRIYLMKTSPYPEERTAALDTIFETAGPLNAYGRYKFFMDIGRITDHHYVGVIREKLAEVIPARIPLGPGQVVMP